MERQSAVRSLSEQELRERIVEVEERMDCLETTLAAVAGETNSLSLGGRCDGCDESLMLIKDGTIYCPHCGNGQSL